MEKRIQARTASRYSAGEGQGSPQLPRRQGAGTGGLRGEADGEGEARDADLGVQGEGKGAHQSIRRAQ